MNDLKELHHKEVARFQTRRKIEHPDAEVLLEFIGNHMDEESVAKMAQRLMENELFLVGREIYTEYARYLIEQHGEKPEPGPVVEMRGDPSYDAIAADRRRR